MFFFLRIVFDLNKLNNVNELEKFDGFETYKLTKTAELLFAKELANRLKGIFMIKIK